LERAGVILFFMYPKTVKEAVALILSEMSLRDKLIIRNTKKEDLIKFNLSWGSEIRNHCGLWDNDVLMRDISEFHPDGASLRIMEAVWDELQKV
jgi:Domain of unknown function (DUF6794)